MHGSGRFPTHSHGSNDSTSPQQLMRYAGMAGGGLVAVSGLRRGGAVGGLLTGLGIGLVLKSAQEQRAASGRAPVIGLQRTTIHLESTVNIDRPKSDIYDFWRSFVRLPEVMDFLDRIEPDSRGYTRWVAKGPLGSSVEWTSEVTEDVPNERIAWASLTGSDIHTWGDVTFKQGFGGLGTDVTVNLNFEPPGGMIGAAVNHFLSGLENAVLNQNLRHLKAYMETGEVPTNRTQKSGRLL